MLLGVNIIFIRNVDMCYVMIEKMVNLFDLEGDIILNMMCEEVFECVVLGDLEVVCEIDG